MPGLLIPDGYRLLEKGEWFKPSVDLYSRDAGVSWMILRHGGRYNPSGHWVAIRPVGK